MFFGDQRSRDLITLASAFTIMAVIVFMRAGVVEDAYITFRVVDNAVHGYGLRWNIFDRVQVYTNPLWMLLHIPFYFFWNNIYYVTLGLSVLCLAAACIVTFKTFAKPAPEKAGLFIIPLSVSSSFADYSTSGLENPLTHLLFALFGFVFFRVRRQRAFWLSFICALSMVNRMDTVLVYLPAMIYLVLRESHSRTFKQLLIGGLPFMAWISFSFIYYGFVFPNTKYAKLGTGWPEIEYFRQGLNYLLNFLVHDMMGATLVLIMIIGTLAITPFYPSKVAREFLCLALGVLLYCGYIIYVGGTTVSGRFWSLPVFASAWLAYGMHNKYFSIRTLYGLIVLMLVLKLTYPTDIRKYCPRCFHGGIATEGWRLLARENPRIPQVNYRRTGYAKLIAVGFKGYKSGPHVTIIDMQALGDPLLARLPAADRHMKSMQWITRDIPVGYERAVKTGSLEEMDKSLAQYYQKLRVITQGDLWTFGRLKTIITFNLGEYDYLREKYLQHIKP